MTDDEHPNGHLKTTSFLPAAFVSSLPQWAEGCPNTRNERIDILTKTSSCSYTTMATSWINALECCFPQLSHAQRLARLKAAEDDFVHDDDSSTYSETSDGSDYSSSSFDNDDDDNDNDSEEGDETLLQQQQLLQNLKSRPGGMFVSDAVKTMLRNNIATGHHLGPSAPSPVAQNAMMRRGSGTAETPSSAEMMAMAVNLTLSEQLDSPTKSYSDETKQQHGQDIAEPTISPSDKLNELLRARGITPTIRASNDLKDYFFESKQEHIDAYTMDVMTAVRAGNVDALRDMLHQGRQLQCCNKFYESILHAAARRGGPEVLLFLLHEANLELRVCCASGRVPLHDACWTASPDFETIKLILEECPDFLLISDNRNFTPLSYVPKDAWDAWTTFLESNQELLIPKMLV